MGKQSTHAPIRSAGVLGTARWKGGAGNRWRPVWHEGRGLNVANRRRCRRGSDRAILLLRPGNAGGGKGPDFWCASEDGEGMVIGESLQTPEVPGVVGRSSAARRRQRPPLVASDHGPCRVP